MVISNMFIKFFSKLKLYLFLAGSFALALLLSWFSGKSAGKQEAKTEKLEDYIETRKRTDEVSRPTDVNSARDWLRKHGSK
jgi:hypothetical protein